MQSLEVIIWDVQHGSSTFIKTPNGKTYVIDLGIGSCRGSSDFSPLLYLQQKYMVSNLDKVIITHPHNDHIADIFNFDKMNPRILFRPIHLTTDEIRGDYGNNNPKIEKYLEINSRYSEPVLEQSDPDLSQNNGGVIIKSFIPSHCDRNNLNNHSVVTVFQYANSKILIPGDNEPPSWEELLERSDFREAIFNSDILVAPHHGRESAYYPQLFDFFAPKLVIISDGPCDSSAVSKYSAISSGWVVHRRTGTKEKRYCLTTRKDGVIRLQLGFENSNPFLFVSIN